jgi:hypothetical protein
MLIINYLYVYEFENKACAPNVTVHNRAPDARRELIEQTPPS